MQPETRWREWEPFFNAFIELLLSDSTSFLADAARQVDEMKILQISYLTVELQSYWQRLADSLNASGGMTARLQADRMKSKQEDEIHPYYYENSLKFVVFGYTPVLIRIIA